MLLTVLGHHSLKSQQLSAMKLLAITHYEHQVDYDKKNWIDFDKFNAFWGRFLQNDQRVVYLTLSLCLQLRDFQGDGISLYLLLCLEFYVTVWCLKQVVKCSYCSICTWWRWEGEKRPSSVTSGEVIWYIAFSSDQHAIYIFVKYPLADSLLSWWSSICKTWYIQVCSRRGLVQKGKA